MTLFQSKEYLDLFARHFVTNADAVVDDVFEILTDKRAVLLGMKPVLNGQEITDYGEVLDPTPENITQQVHRLKEKYEVTAVQFDYVRENSPLFLSLSTLTSEPPVQQEVSPFITLPESWDIYLESLERTDRKELKRKLKRLDTVAHNFRYTCLAGRQVNTSQIESEFELFIKLHKLSDHSKDQFMTDPMKVFFKDLFYLDIPGWSQKLAFLTIEDKPSAAIIYFESENEVLLYNSGYDPEQKFYSAGLLLVAELIKKSIGEKKKTFDFLRGNERYKYDLGGIDVRLFRFLLH